MIMRHDIILSSLFISVPFYLLILRIHNTNKNEQDIKHKKKATSKFDVALIKNLAVPAFPVRLQTSIIGAVDFTSVFEMGTGVSPLLYPPGNFIDQFNVCDLTKCR